MIYSSLDSSHRDESNDSKIIQIEAIFVEIAIFAKIIAIFAKISGQIGSGQLSDPTRYFRSVQVRYPDHGSKFGALIILSTRLYNYIEIGVIDVLTICTLIYPMK